MNERIKILTDLTLQGKMYVDTVSTDLDVDSDIDKLCKYILNQEPKITKYSAFTGNFLFDESVIDNTFKRGEHKNTEKTLERYHLKSKENLSTMERQHVAVDYKKVLDEGLSGVMNEINFYLDVYMYEPKKMEFLSNLARVASALVEWTEKCSNRVSELAKRVENEEDKKRLNKLAGALKHSPRYKPRTFYEAVLSIYVCFSTAPDSLGLLDRYLTPFYENDIKNGILTREEAKEYLQELFLMLQACTHINSPHFTRGGESHFCIGGYLPNGEDGFNEVSRLIVESLMELPTYIPQITLRWTKKTPKEVLYYMMDMERKDEHKRIAFTNDEKRIKCYTEICKIPYERAVSYTMIGCNEPAFLGAITGSNSKGNILRCVDTLFHKKHKEIETIDTFEDFYKIFEKELLLDLGKIYAYDNKYNLEGAKDVNYISSLLLNDCIENGKSLTQGGGNYVIASPALIGMTNLIDSISIVKQFVFDEKIVTMKELIEALHQNWSGDYESLHALIRKKGKFFGNDDETSNYVSSRIYNSFYEYLKNKKNIFGYQFLIGNLLGYNEHHKWFGENTNATPDGRYAGETLNLCIGQRDGEDRNGLTALLNSIAHLDKNAISCGSTVTNITLDKALVENEASFKKLVDLFEEFFKQGGIHFQLTYVSKEEVN